MGKDDKYFARALVAFIILALDQIATSYLGLSTTDSLLLFIAMMSVVLLLAIPEDEEE